MNDRAARQGLLPQPIWLPQRFWLPLVLSSVLAWGLLAFYRVFFPVYQAGILLRSTRWLLVSAVCGAALVAVAVLLAAGLARRGALLEKGLASLLGWLGELQAGNYLILAGLVCCYSFLVLGPPGIYLQDPWARLYAFYLLVLAGALLLKAALPARSWFELLAGALAFSAAGFRLAVFALDVSTFPFSLNWSEASRFYYASLFFARQLYGLDLPPTVLHPSRYLMQAVPFLVPALTGVDLPLWLHRLWQVLLWTGTTSLTTYLFTRRLDIADAYQRWILSAWTFMFLLLGPVYYHLQVPVILILWGFNRRSFWRSTLVVLLASAWTGISRVNWYPVPAMLAIALYLLEETIFTPAQDEATGATPPPAEKKYLFWRYIWKPALWGLLGLATAFGAQAAYITWSGNQAKEFTTSLSSDLLWYRLMPNPTYPTGILINIFLVTLPFGLLIYLKLRGRWQNYHWVRLLGLSGIMVVLLVGGLLVSVKIGGGSNLHNLDAYMTLLLVIAAWVHYDRFQPDRLAAPAPAGGTLARRLEAAALLVALALPVYDTVMSGGPMPLISPQQTAEALGALTKQVSEASKSGEVLFIAERQLLTFHQLPGIRLVPDYERVFLMEMVMAGSPEYLGRFHDQLKDHRYAMIVSEPLFVQYKGRAEGFGEENDAWVNQVSRYVLCYYQPKRMLRDIHVQLLVPRDQPDQDVCP